MRYADLMPFLQAVFQSAAARNVNYRQAQSWRTPSTSTHGGAVNKMGYAQPPVQSDSSGVTAVGKPLALAKTQRLPVVAGLRPKQVLAAMMLVEGRMAKDVAHHLHVSAETVSRWRAQPAFHLLMRELLQESIDATRLGLVALCSESILHLRGLIGAFDDKTALKAISLLFSKAGPVLAAINAEVQRPVAGD